MKLKLLLAAVVVIFLFAVISKSGSSQPDLESFEILTIKRDLLDAITQNRLSEYEASTDKSYLLGGFPLRSSGSTSSKAPVSIEKSINLFENADTLNTIFDSNSLTLILEPEATCEAESKFLGLYKRKKITIRGLELTRLLREESTALILKLEK